MTNIVENARRVRRRRREALKQFEKAIAYGADDWFEVADNLATAFTGRRRERKPVSAIRYLIGQGGVCDDGGELRSMGCVRLRPGLVSRAGIPLDTARERLVEAGYLIENGPGLPPCTTVDDVLELIREELSGRPRYIEEPPFEGQRGHSV